MDKEHPLRADGRAIYLAYKNKRTYQSMHLEAYPRNDEAYFQYDKKELGIGLA